MSRGNVVLINGTSSAGKTSLARALQAIMEAPYLHTGNDHFLPRLPERCFAVCDVADQTPFDYFQLVYRGGTQRSVGEREGGVTVYSMAGVLAEVRIGPGAIALLAGMYRSIAALSEVGVDVIVDDAIFDQRVLRAAVAALRHSPVLFVGVRLPLGVAEQREQERGDRGPGGAAAFYHLVHAHGVYDLEVDTARNRANECAEQVKAALLNGQPRQAISELARRFDQQREGDGEARSA